MTGRDLILYILANGLEDEPIFENETFIGFMTERDFAAKCNVGIATVHTWAMMGKIEFVSIGGSVYIPINALLNITPKGDI